MVPGQKLHVLSSQERFEKTILLHGNWRIYFLNLSGVLVTMGT